MIPKELDDLIKEYLTDGIITSKERQVLLKKAQKLGLDVDEVDLYIDAQQQKVDQAADAAMRMARGKACPFCGAVIPPLTDKCPECGKVITPEASNELKEIIDNLEEALVDVKDNNNFDRAKAKVERFARKARMYYSNNPKIKALLAEVNEETAVAEKKMKSQRRKKTIVSIIKNKWTYVCLIVITAVIIITLCSNNYWNLDEDEKEGIILCCVGSAFFAIVAAIPAGKD